jgi:hypothetical protein
MKTEQQQKLVYILFYPFLAISLASTLIVGKYPEYTDHVTVGLGVVVVLLGALAVFMLKCKAT